MVSGQRTTFIDDVSTRTPSLHSLLTATPRARQAPNIEDPLHRVPYPLAVVSGKVSAIPELADVQDGDTVVGLATTDAFGDPSTRLLSVTLHLIVKQCM